MKTIAIATALFGLAGAPAIAATATAQLAGTDGSNIGTVTVTDTPSGMAHVTAELQGLPEGVHGIHIHETGDCSASDFTSAGGHLAGEAQHGVMVENGPHPGDLPNAHIAPDGSVTVEAFLPDFDVAELMMDDDGSAFIVHAGADDYESQPSGDAGSRLACGVFEGK
ncbi:superoxide dismutase family protein [Yangia mangrovi]|uniref:Superoxide dismutase n=1 Tax=Alloyangia mangrovi TaxID=1779329 RepID=A0A2A3K309_9RHOB|nr:superoxide dismutase family protein [Alloyangia mangrovi]MCA0941039.1 superoxide dismutase family protein [Alloyangia pacifica]MCA0944379.1 superoxide dismutase family protein [Alloyangia pacifica]MCT4371802.1 superoxide dismutase family protein [Alloyangia mangrovi]